MEKDKKLILDFELVPDGCWYSNLRSILPPEMWSIVRKEAIARAGGKCAVCHTPTNYFEAHEVWSYDVKTKTQKLEDVIAICRDCHAVKHIGRTQLKGDEDRAIKHFLTVNGCLYADYRKALGKANERHRELNKVDEWKLDLSYLKKFGK